ncbi:hypothetical protein QE109_04660 [Fusibacter bizertensis]|uniref:Uncharacterized protein n=1 Tax=Fusibacter bizertensis TaxID=1488331 RepID=A0ABT6NAK3_9FIRM|nr:hypothetical protein [Fusibacter bizertensis]MDH8677425.1 hypothetical protein [Fusibacter bizertensis]
MTLTSEIVGLIAIVGSFIIMIISIMYNYQILNRDKKLSSRVILDYEMIYSCGLRLESMKFKEGIRILETENYFNVKKANDKIINNAKNCFEKYRKVEDYINSGQFIKIMNKGPCIVHNLSLNITIDTSFGDIQHNGNEEITATIPVLGVDENAYVLINKLPSKLPSLLSNVKTFSSIPVMYSQNLSRINITYLTQYNEKIMIEGKYSDNILNYEVNVIKNYTNERKISKIKVKENLMKYKMSSTGTWLYPYTRIKNEEVYKNNFT